MCRKTQTQMLAWENYSMLQDFISLVIYNKFNVILYLSTCHTVYVSVLIHLMIMP